MKKNFLIVLRYKVPIEVVEQHTEAHRAYLRTLYASQELLMSGPFVPRTAGVLWAQAADRNRIEEMIARDPFHTEGVADYEVNEFAPTTFDPLLEPVFSRQKEG